MTQVLSLIGLAYRARKCAEGTESIIRQMQLKQVFLLLIAEDISAGSRKKLTDKCTSYNIPYVEVADRKSLGQAIGKQERVAIAILDEGFSKKLQSLLL